MNSSNKLIERELTLGGLAVILSMGLVVVEIITMWNLIPFIMKMLPKSLLISEMYNKSKSLGILSFEMQINLNQCQ